MAIRLHVAVGVALVGFLIAWARPGYRWLPIAFLAVEFPVAFLYDRGLVDLAA